MTRVVQFFILSLICVQLLSAATNVRMTGGFLENWKNVEWTRGYGDKSSAQYMALSKRVCIILSAKLSGSFDYGDCIVTNITEGSPITNPPSSATTAATTLSPTAPSTLSSSATSTTSATPASTTSQASTSTITTGATSTATATQTDSSSSTPSPTTPSMTTSTPTSTVTTSSTATESTSTSSTVTTSTPADTTEESSTGSSTSTSQSSPTVSSSLKVISGRSARRVRSGEAGLKSKAIISSDVMLRDGMVDLDKLKAAVMAIDGNGYDNDVSVEITDAASAAGTIIIMPIIFFFVLNQLY